MGMGAGGPGKPLGVNRAAPLPLFCVDCPMLHTIQFPAAIRRVGYGRAYWGWAASRTGALGAPYPSYAPMRWTTSRKISSMVGV